MRNARSSAFTGSVTLRGGMGKFPPSRGSSRWPPQTSRALLGAPRWRRGQ
ncbi:MAG: hypothetical protein MZV64_49085 [Ignavibacteriales bacterium]|nr:hypothetical protein [Ignavibacteriales bacterium]